MGGQADQKNLSASNELKQAFLVYSPGGLETEWGAGPAICRGSGQPPTPGAPDSILGLEDGESQALAEDQERLSGCFGKC